MSRPYTGSYCYGQKPALFYFCVHGVAVPVFISQLEQLYLEALPYTVEATRQDAQHDAKLSRDGRFYGQKERPQNRVSGPRNIIWCE